MHHASLASRFATCLLTSSILLCVSAGASFAQDFSPRQGDIVFHESTSRQSEAIALVTKSRYTHMGIVFEVDGKPMVLEASSTVKMTPYATWVARGVDGHVVVKRLAEGVPDKARIAAMRKVGEELEGTRYDVKFLWSDRTMYCSELVWKIYARGADVELAELATYADFDLSNPKVARLVKARFGKRAVPLEEPVISPAAIFDSELLVTVFETPKP